MVSLKRPDSIPRIRRSGRSERWVVDNQILGPGDWQVKNPGAAPGGWAFEFKNDFYPDVDDTAFVLMALKPRSDPDPEAAPFDEPRVGVATQHAEPRRRLGRLRQENDLQFLNHIPFADHNAMLDPSTADVTARAVECLGHMGWPADHPVLQRARAFIHQDQTRRRFLVRPLGRELHLRNQRRPTCSRNRLGLAKMLRVERPSSGCAPCRIPTAASANPSFPITIRT